MEISGVHCICRAVTPLQVRALLEHVEMAGAVLDCCGSTNDAVSTVLTERGLRVTTNDFNAMYVFLRLSG